MGIKNFLIFFQFRFVSRRFPPGSDWPDRAAGGKQPNFIKHAINNSRALVAVRLLPAIASGSRVGINKAAGIAAADFDHRHAAKGRAL